MSDPAGSNGSIQFNANGVFGGTSNITTDTINVIFQSAQANNAGFIGMNPTSNNFRIGCIDAPQAANVGIRPGTSNSNNHQSSLSNQFGTAYIQGGDNSDDTGGEAGWAAVMGGYGGPDEVYVGATVFCRGGANTLAGGATADVSIYGGSDGVKGGDIVLGSAYNSGVTTGTQGYIILQIPILAGPTPGNVGDVLVSSGDTGTAPSWQLPNTLNFGVQSQYVFVPQAISPNSAPNWVQDEFGNSAGYIYGINNILNLTGYSANGGNGVIVYIGGTTAPTDGTVTEFSFHGDANLSNVMITVSAQPSGCNVADAPTSVSSGEGFGYVFVANSNTWFRTY